MTKDNLDSGKWKESLEEDAVPEKKSLQKKGFIITASFIVGLIIVAFLIVNYYGGNKVKSLDNDVDKLHELNYQGKLPEDRGYFYNGFSFVERDDIWYTRYQKDNKLFGIALHYGPKELEGIPVTGELDPRFNLFKNISMNFDPSEDNLSYVALANGELSMHIVKLFNKRALPACSKNITGCERAEIVPECEEPVKDMAIIFLSQEPGPGIELKGTCIIVKGKGEDLLKSADFLIYRWLKIM